jgi:hypothetical protein
MAPIVKQPFQMLFAVPIAFFKKGGLDKPTFFLIILKVFGLPEKHFTNSLLSKRFFRK